MAIRLNPTNVESLGMIAVIFLTIGSYSEGIFFLDKAIEIEPNNKILYYNRGLGKINSGKKDEAFIDLKKSAQLGNEKAVEILQREFYK